VHSPRLRYQDSACPLHPVPPPLCILYMYLGTICFSDALNSLWPVLTYLWRLSECLFNRDRCHKKRTIRLIEKGTVEARRVFPTRKRRHNASFIFQRVSGFLRRSRMSRENVRVEVSDVDRERFNIFGLRVENKDTLNQTKTNDVPDDCSVQISNMRRHIFKCLRGSNEC
jgi:hypothetical protein